MARKKKGLPADAGEGAECARAPAKKRAQSKQVNKSSRGNASSAAGQTRAHAEYDAMRVWRSALMMSQYL